LGPARRDNHCPDCSGPDYCCSVLGRFQPSLETLVPATKRRDKKKIHFTRFAHRDVPANIPIKMIVAKRHAPPFSGIKLVSS
jgi:hypothetical protein